MNPKRLQLQRTAGWRKPAGAVVVARPSKWGNPFRYRTYQALARCPALDGSPWEYEGRISAHGALHDYHHPDGHVTTHRIRYMTITECVELYHRCIVSPTNQLHIYQGPRKPWLTQDDVQRELAGLDLCCWCQLGKACHGDVLLALAAGHTWTERVTS